MEVITNEKISRRPKIEKIHSLCKCFCPLEITSENIMKDEKHYYVKCKSCGKEIDVPDSMAECL